jgi:hypothetical protein
MVWKARGKFQDWPARAKELSLEKVIQMYEDGFAGATYSEEAVDQFRAAMTYPNGEDVTHAFGLADSGAGKLVIPFVHVVEMFPGCWPGRQGQARGDCVSWGTRNAALLTMVCDIVSGQPDQVTGKPEQKPDVPAEGVADGVLSTETFYWYRGYNGDGWHCPAAATVACRKSGLMVRKDYPEFGVNLTTYSGRNAGAYGAKAPGPEIQKAGQEHLIHQATEASTFEACRDLLYNGYGVSTCGGEGLSNKRDENGVSKRSGSWAHAMAYIGADDRDVIKQKYGEPLVLDLNSWADWNSGPRDILDSAGLVPPEKKDAWVRAGIVNSSTGNIMIPEGSCWVRYSEMKRREMIAFSGANGWPAKALPYLI